MTLFLTSVSFGQRECIIGVWVNGESKFEIKNDGSYLMHGTCRQVNEKAVFKGNWTNSGNIVSLSPGELVESMSGPNSKLYCQRVTNVIQLSFDNKGNMIQPANYKKQGNPCNPNVSNDSENDVGTSPTQQELEQKMYEGLQAGAQKYQDGQERKKNLQNEFDNPEGVTYVHIEDRSKEAAHKANYDATNDLDALFGSDKKELTDSMGEYDEDEPKISNSEKEILKKDLDRMFANSFQKPIRTVDEIFQNDLYYEQGKSRMDPCDLTSVEDDISGDHTITWDDIENDPFVSKPIEEYKDEIKGLLVQYFGGEAAGVGYSFFDRMSDQKDAIDEVESAKNDIENVQDGWFEAIFSFDENYVENWIAQKQSVTSEYLDRYKLWNKMEAIRISNRYEREMGNLDHEEVMRSDCDDIEYGLSGYKYNCGKELDKIIGINSNGIFNSLLYGL